jgi:nucleotide sugar dehydrogenase
MKIGFVGMGFVGGTTYQVFKQSFECIGYDKYKEEFSKNFSQLSGCNIIFISLPTPMQKDGKIDLSIIHSALLELKQLDFAKKPLVVLRSTIVPGSTDSMAKEFGQFRFAFSPEFLRENHALEDFKNSNKVVFGVADKKDYDELMEIYSRFLPNATYFQTDIKTAEMVKYASNCTLASQIIIANEINAICDKSGIDYQTVLKIISLDNRIGKNMSVPGFDGLHGFGGKCFPKDLSALIAYSKEIGYNPEFFQQVWNSNLKFRERKDWEDIPGATSNNLNFNKKS